MCCVFFPLHIRTPPPFCLKYWDYLDKLESDFFLKIQIILSLKYAHKIYPMMNLAQPLHLMIMKKTIYSALAMS